MTHVLNLEEEILFFERSADGDKEFFSLMDLLMFCSTVATITLLWPNQIREADWQMVKFDLLLRISLFTTKNLSLLNVLNEPQQ